MQKVVIMDRLSYRWRQEDVSDGLADVSCVVSGLFASPYGLSAAFSQQLSVSCQLEPALCISLPLLLSVVQSHSQDEGR